MMESGKKKGIFNYKKYGYRYFHFFRADGNITCTFISPFHGLFWPCRMRLAEPCPPPARLLQGNSCPRWSQQSRTFCTANTRKTVKVAFACLQRFLRYTEAPTAAYVQTPQFKWPLLREFIPSLVKDPGYKLYSCLFKQICFKKEFKIPFM